MHKIIKVLMNNQSLHQETTIKIITKQYKYCHFERVALFLFIYLLINSLFKMTENERNRLKGIIKEELTKMDVRGMIDNALDNFIKERELRKKIREITSDVLDDLFRELWQKKGFWKNNLKNG